MIFKKRTLYSKTVSIFLIVLLLSFTFSGIMLYMFLDDYLYNTNLVQLENTVNQISIFLIDLAKNPGERGNFFHLMESYINSYISSGMYIFVLDNYAANKTIIVSAPMIDFDDDVPFDKSFSSRGHGLQDKLPNEIKNKLEPGSFYFRKEYSDKIVNAITPDIQAFRGDFFGLYEDTGVSWHTVTKRVDFVNHFGYPYSYSLIISTPEKAVYDARSQVIKYFASSVAVSSAIAMIVVSFYTSMITRPLKQLKESAKRVARGDFSDEIVAKSNDEVGELIRSYNTMVKDLKSLDKVKSDFIANVSHDLRTPLTSINGFLGGILDGTIPEEKREYYLQIVRDEVQRMTSLVNSLLELTKFEKGSQKFNFQSLNINELIRTCIVKYENIIMDKNLDIEVDFENDDEFAIGDKEAIERVFINLLHNAIKFTDSGGKITVGTRKLKNNKVEIYVQDTGIGIDANDIDFIWDRFYKSDKSRGMDKTGTGLGLSICKSILNAHDQDLYVESKLGEGSKFIFTLNSV